ncbi:YdaS family helix-turn-helix protein, partial [Chitinimonas sp.]|uniref:YdaS family helix-turn-helix protein n=1 Tax=Chitinimonas sp. TaxID=1934313 RepID=UPI0035B00935
MDTKTPPCVTAMACQATIKYACNLLGGQNELASLLGVSAAHVSNWTRGHALVNKRRAIQVESALKGAVTRMHLRPDIAWH